MFETPVHVYCYEATFLYPYARQQLNPNWIIVDDELQKMSLIMDLISKAILSSSIDIGWIFFW